MGTNKKIQTENGNRFLRGGYFKMRNSVLLLCLLTLGCFGVGFSSWTIGVYTGSASGSAEVGVLTEIEDTFSYLALSANEELTTKSLSYYSYQQVGSLDEEENYVAVSVDVSYGFSSNQISVVMDLDKSSENFDVIAYDSSDLYGVTSKLSIVNSDQVTSLEEGTETTYVPSSFDPEGLTVSLSDASSDGSQGFETGKTIRVTISGYDGYEIEAVYANDVECRQSSTTSNVYTFTKTAYKTYITISWNLSAMVDDYISSATLRPYYLPSYEFEMEKSSSTSGLWYFPVKSTKAMSLYSVFGYDYSYKASSTEQTIPVEFVFTFEESLLSSLMNILDLENQSLSFHVTFELVSSSEYGI